MVSVLAEMIFEAVELVNTLLKKYGLFFLRSSVFEVWHINKFEKYKYSVIHWANFIFICQMVVL